MIQYPGLACPGEGSEDAPRVKTKRAARSDARRTTGRARPRAGPRAVAARAPTLMTAPPLMTGIDSDWAQGEHRDDSMVKRFIVVMNFGVTTNK